MFSFATSKTSYSGLPCIELEATHEQHWFLRRAVRDNHTDSPFYKKKQKVNPFIQCGGFEKEGYILIEFWGDPQLVPSYIDWLNSQYEEEIKYANRLGLLEYDLNSSF